MDVSVTVVGAGRYGHDLIAPVYKSLGISFRGFISPHHRGRETAYFRSVKEWVRHFGRPDENDVFDVAVHVDKIPQILSELAKIGARKIILPKPVALYRQDMELIMKLQSRYKLNLQVASQWHYSAITAMLAGRVCKRPTEIYFSQVLPETYTPVTSFLPHILQIIFSANLSPNSETRIIRADRYSLAGTQGNVSFTSSVSGEKRRWISVEGLFDIDAVTESRNGHIRSHATLIEGGKKSAIFDEPLQQMTEKVMAAFQNPEEEAGTMTLQNYLPVAHKVIEANLLYMGLLKK